MSEKVYLIKDAELAVFSKEKINVALDWVVDTAGSHPELSVVELVSLLKGNVDNAVGETEDWVYGVSGTASAVDAGLGDVVVPEAEVEEEEGYELPEETFEIEEPEDEVFEIEEDQEDEDYDYEPEVTEDVAEEAPAGPEVVGVDVETAIVNVINFSDNGKVTIDELRAGLGDNFSEEEFGQGFWALVEAETITFNDDIISITGTEAAVEEEPETAEEDEEVDFVDEETEFAPAPVFSRTRQYQGLFREAGKMDK